MGGGFGSCSTKVGEESEGGCIKAGGGGSGSGCMKVGGERNVKFVGTSGSPSKVYK